MFARAAVTKGPDWEAYMTETGSPPVQRVRAKVAACQGSCGAREGASPQASLLPLGSSGSSLGSLGLRGISLLSAVIFTWFSLCTPSRVQIPPFHKDTGRAGLELTHTQL